MENIFFYGNDLFIWMILNKLLKNSLLQLQANTINSRVILSGWVLLHAGGADADALLPATHPQAVKLRSVEQLAEYFWDLGSNTNYVCVIKSFSRNAT